MMKFKKHTYKTWMAALLLGMATLPSCEQESLVTTFEEAAPNTLSLRLFCSESNESRSADDTYNEDAIHRLDIFLYPSNAESDTPVVYQDSIKELTANENHTVNLSLTNAQIEDLFGPNGTTCKIYAIANLPKETTLPSGKPTVDQLKALTITAAFNTFKTENQISVYQPQADFVMDSDFVIDGENDKVTLDRDNHTLRGTVPLFRAASKISLVITDVKDVPMTNENNEPVYEILEDGSFRTEQKDNEQPIKWTANTSGMLVRLHDGVSKSHIDNSVQPYDVQEKTETQEGDYFSFAKGQEVKMTSVESDWKNIPAFYSYSSDWSTGTDEEPYLTLIVPWARSDEKNADGKPYYQNTYYQVPISTVAKSLVRNTHYKINLVVSRLGSFVEEKPEVISPSSYIIVPWQSETVNADLMDYRYLMVEEKDITIYNEDELYIPYVTSHEAEIVSVVCEQRDLSKNTPGWKDASYDALNLTQKEGFIYFKNELDNNYKSTTFDFTPYKITFTIRHKDEEGRDDYYENVTITQYPAIYGEAEENWDYSNNYNASTGNITENVTNDRDGNNGFVFVNGYQNTGGNSYDFFLSANGIEDLNANTYSPNMYVFNVTSVEGTPYVVGDPRDNSITYNEESADWAVAKALYDGASNRELKYYYGTDVTSESYNNSTSTNAIYANDKEAEAAERTINMIAPKFRLASAYAVLYPYTDYGANRLEILKKRCASYQEDGYPAGRWRLPTRAEFEFIMTQVNRTPAALPAMYIKGSSYWCAHGVGLVQDDNSIKMSYVARSSSGYSTRCVYDEWYWTDKLETPAEKNVFTWGDQPR